VGVVRGRKNGWRSLTLLIALAIVGCSAAAQPLPPAPAPVPATVDGAVEAPDSALTQAAVADTFDPAKWAPPETGPSAIAAALLATLPEPGAIALPADLPGTGTSLGGSSASAISQTGASATSATCFEVQIGASGDRKRAENLSRSAGSLLGTESRVASSGSLHRVRIGGCMTETDALHLRDRARLSGYSDAFLVNPVD
jgi:cell division septation protein DedD